MSKSYTPVQKRTAKEMFGPSGRPNLQQIINNYDKTGLDPLDYYILSGLDPEGFMRQLNLGTMQDYVTDPQLRLLGLSVRGRIESYEDYRRSLYQRHERSNSARIAGGVKDMFWPPRRALYTTGAVTALSGIVGAAKNVLGHNYTTLVKVEPSSIKIPFGPEISIISKDVANTINNTQNALAVVSDAIVGATNGLVFTAEHLPQILGGLILTGGGAYAWNRISRKTGEDQIEEGVRQNMERDIEERMDYTPQLERQMRLALTSGNVIDAEPVEQTDETS